MNMHKKIIHSALFLIGLAVIIALTSIAVKPDKEIYDILSVEKKLKELKAERADSIDLVFIGDSEVYSAYNPLQMYEEYGFTSYVCATYAQRLCDTYALLQEVFRTQNPKVVALETNCIFRYGGLSDDSEDKVLSLVSHYIPAMKYHTRLKMYLLDGSPKNKLDMKGFIYRNDIKPYTGGQWMKPSDSVEKIRQCNMDYLQKIYELVNDNDCKLIFISTPSPVCQTYKRHNAVAELAGQWSTDYIDLNLDADKIQIDWATDTKDAGNHLNYAGALKVSRYVGQILSSAYSLPDHRDDGKYISWKQDFIDSQMEI